MVYTPVAIISAQFNNFSRFVSVMIMTLWSENIFKKKIVCVTLPIEGTHILTHKTMSNKQLVMLYKTKVIGYQLYSIQFNYMRTLTMWRMNFNVSPLLEVAVDLTLINGARLKEFFHVNNLILNLFAVLSSEHIKFDGL